MLSEEKLKKMIRLAEYEQGIGSTDLKRVSYIKADYVRIRLLKSIVSVVVAAFLTVGLIAVLKMEYILRNALSLPFGKIALVVGGAFFIFLIVTGVISCYMSAKAYDESELRAREYFKTLQELSDLYENEEQGQEEFDL